MGFKKDGFRLMAEENQQREIQMLPAESTQDVMVIDQRGSVHEEIICMVAEFLYGDRYGNFEIALDNIGLSNELQKNFRINVYRTLMQTKYFNLATSQQVKGLTLAIVEEIIKLYPNSIELGNFIWQLDELYQSHLEDHLRPRYKSIKSSDQLVDLVINILTLDETWLF